MPKETGLAPSSPGRDRARRPLRLVLLTRRYWPLVGGAEAVMANLASEFKRRGARVTILTARWEPHWPTELVHREVPVVRLHNPPQRGWGTLRYMCAASRWLRTNREQFDLVYVSMLKHDAYAAIGALTRSAVPVVLRAEGGGPSGDCHWHETGRFGKRIRHRCQNAAATVAPSLVIADELRSAGFLADRVHFIPNGVAIPDPRDSPKRIAARLALADVNEDLSVQEGAPLVVFTGRLQAAKGLFDLLKAWPPIVARWPAAKLWLVGEGPDREELFETVLDLQLRSSVRLPGAFDETGEVLQAADLFVLPSYEEGMSMSLLEAMAAGVPVIASDIPGNRQLVTHEQHGLLVAPRDHAALSQAITRQLQQTTLGAAWAEAARRRVIAEFSLRRMAERHEELFRSLIS